jgi:hypothetical protein
MKTGTRRDTLLPTSVSTSWLFWITFCFGCFLALYTPYKLWAEAAQRIDLQGPSLGAYSVYCLGALAGLMGLRWCILIVLSYASMVRREQQPGLQDGDASLPFVSILAPAYNEAACVTDALSALVGLDYSAYEVIFVDDGSTDSTYELALSFAGTHRSRHGMCDVRIFTKPNGGKWSAHNFGLRHAKGELVLCIDADSRIEGGSLRLMVRHMRDGRVGAVSGQIRVRNRKSLLGLFQAFEYVLANGALRLSQGATGAVMVVPGPIGLFRREALDRVEAENERAGGFENQEMPGPFSPLTFAEDFSPLPHNACSRIQSGVRTACHRAHQGSSDAGRSGEPAVSLESRDHAGNPVVCPEDVAGRQVPAVHQSVGRDSLPSGLLLFSTALFCPACELASLSAARRQPLEPRFLGHCCMPRQCDVRQLICSRAPRSRHSRSTVAVL